MVRLTLPPVFLGLVGWTPIQGSNYCSIMLEHVDLTDSHAVERARRSVVMLRPGQLALSREDGMRLLAALLAHLEREG